MNKFGIIFLRISLAIVYLWFGFLKIFNMSPVAHIIQNTLTFLPFPQTMIALGILEVLIGIGLLWNVFTKITITLLWIQLFGIFLSVFLNPFLFFYQNPLMLTLEGEFTLKDIVFIGASFIILGQKKLKLYESS